ncbi:hypothetical protein F5148DRAFT_1155299 [Russula earlei]|uniref:Uncharacterized protein n=1 Tax=Russula earlei TaxID=71964 RepID=A0ACC0UNX2_9AGAM|nr:hypothetical protein F5148DRAFT_1155299 [Russula earlei]
MELSSSLGGLSVRTIRDAHLSAVDTSAGVSLPSSPRSSALPSPPDSPDSISSSPSLSSSFFFSSAAASPPHVHAHIEQDRESAQGLIIPSLILPTALRQPTPHGKTLGDVRILVFGSAGPGGSSIARTLLDDNEDIVDVGPSDVTHNGHVVRASTDWAEHRDAHGLEKFEPTHNVEILDVSKHASADEIDNAIARILAIIHEPFRDLLHVIDPGCPPSALLSNLISSSSSPLYVALIVHPQSLSSRHRSIIDSLGAHIPVVVLPSTELSRARLPISAFRPSSLQALRAGIFRSPETVNLLRSEAADRFLRWREVERAACTVHDSRTDARSQQGPAWDKAAWETEWDATLSRDVARRLRENTATFCPSQLHAKDATCLSAFLDPFHIPSLVMFSLSLFAPFKENISQMTLSGRRLGFVLVGTLCAGVGVGLALRTGF